MKTIKTYRLLKLRLSVLTVLACTMIFSSCEQFDLEEEPTKVQLSVLPYTNLAELELAVTGAYARYWNAHRQTTYHVAAYAGDDVTSHRASNKADFREYDQRNITVANTRLTTNWNRVFEAVRACNLVLVNLEGVELTEIDEQNRLKGEMHFMRGVLYLHLTRMYGTLPLVLDLEIDPNIQLSTQAEVYAQIESDFQMAESLLPTVSNPGATRPNSGSAKALLARLYLDMAGFQGGYDSSRYTMAAAKAKEVIDNSASHGFALVEDMSTLYTHDGAINSESVSTVGFCNSCGRPNLKYGKLGLPGDFGGWQETFAEIRFFEDFPEGPRKEATYHLTVPANGSASSYSLAADPANPDFYVKWEEFADQKNPVFRKIVGPYEEGFAGQFRTSRADYLMRYAEVLLIYAEASGRSGNVTAAAWEALNKVRRRAAGLPVNTPNASVDLNSGDIAELAYLEKKWELAGEYLRWYDLIRLERVADALGNRNPQTSVGTDVGGGNPSPLTEASNPIIGSLGTDNYFSRLPESEVDQLPGLERQSPYDPQ